MAGLRPEAKSGERVDSTWTTVSLSDGRRLGIGIDIRDRKERERKLREAKEAAEEAARLKSAMLANMSHEVRTPLTAINGFSEILREDLEPPHQDLAERIHRGGKRLMQTLDSVLKLSKLEAGEYELPQKPVDLRPLANEAAELHRQDSVEKGLSLEVEQSETPVVAMGHEGALNRVL